VLRLPDQWIWDSWVADDGERFHLYFLQAPRALGDPTLRHAAARIGHATSFDLVDWTYHGVALGPGEEAWNDLAAWTGSVVRAGCGWRMYYTALSTAGHGIRDQRLGLAESDDLMRWRRVGDAPVVEIDRARYRTLDEDPRASQTWRDPFVFRDPGGDGWHMLITARDAHAPRLDDGVIAHARSADGLRWELGPPLTVPGTGFGEIEVPQVRVVDGRPLLVFCCHPEEQSRARRREHGAYCTWCVTARSVLGPWDLAAARPFVDVPKLFGAPLVRARDGGWVLLGFHNQEAEGILSFEIVDPVPVALEGSSLRRRGARSSGKPIAPYQ